MSLIRDVYDWYDKITIRTIHLAYAVLNEGYLGNPAARKIRAILKSILHSQEACTFHNRLDCRRCPKIESCIFYHFMVDDSLPRPYIIHMTNTRDWQGLLKQGEIKKFDIHLVGKASRLDEWFTRSLARKRLIGLEGLGKQIIKLELESISYSPTSGTFGVAEILEFYKATGLWDGNDVEAVEISFETPLEIRKKKRILNSGEEITFKLFLKALYNRFTTVLSTYCSSQKDSIPPYCEFSSFAGEVRVSNNGLRFITNKPKKNSRIFRHHKSVEYVGGLKGKITFTGNLTPYFPAIALGSFLHVGRKITQGLGQYRITKVNSATS